MRILDLLSLIKRNMLVFCTIVFGVFVLIIIYANFIVQPTYSSVIQYNAIDNVQQTSSYKNYVDDSSFQDDVRQNMVDQHYIDASSMNNLKTISVNVTPGNQVFSITAEATTPLLARQYATTLNTLFQKKFGRAFPNHHITKINGPSNPVSATSPDMKLYIIYGLLGGLIISIVIVLFKELYGKYIYSPFFTTKVLGVHQIGIIEYPKNSGSNKSKE
ncbi:YveK family protein [Lactiplantibacillus mudanjiangensis]|uniref:Exopolysaccharide biosynthesis protein [Lactobacillus acidophilus NCFM] n=1 Tax=Lactiplantibacillus mudanjiangensis TaxID=1296538 RepID=A0A660E882_9LACO|nr:hypothetical protein [Lactiplantibacillus mudanjiangensis]VDG23451.1 exopolysaccharide biosynthesis protein [Lactobacillus acidophilus NCFM] [Lactiplantibacillus mudanjiangensis]VDG29330.1 exopolysaccharide biosynthesis protein [Lactobacillus acidophilus NCFM] [Lactiplantibacillus mudanjiangensis]